MTDMVDLDNNQDKLFIIVKELVFEINFFKRLQGIKIVLKMLNEEQKAECEAESFSNSISKYIEDDLFMRQARLISVVSENTETAIEYYGKDYLNGVDFMYRDEFENKKKIVDGEINSFIGSVLNMIIKGSQLDFL